MHGCKDNPLVRSIFSRDKRSYYMKVSLYELKKLTYLLDVFEDLFSIRRPIRCMNYLKTNAVRLLCGPTM